MPLAMARTRRLDLTMAALASIAALASVPTDRIHESAYTQPEAHGQQPDNTHATRMAWLPHSSVGAAWHEGCLYLGHLGNPLLLS